MCTLYGVLALMLNIDLIRADCADMSFYTVFTMDPVDVPMVSVQGTYPCFVACNGVLFLRSLFTSG